MVAFEQLPESWNYWQWRSALNGQEEIHGVLVGADGTPVPFYDEAAQTARWWRFQA